MPQVPTYDNFQTTPTATPDANFQAQNIPDVAGNQAQQLGQGLSRAGEATSNIATDMQVRANQLRVDDALNKAREASMKLTYDPQQGFANLKGEAALNRPGGQPLAEEYTGKLQDQISGIADSLSNDYQRQLFANESKLLTSRFYGHAMAHEMDQQNVYRTSTNEGTISSRMNEIALNYNDPRLVNEGVNSIRAAVYDQAQALGKSATWAESQARDMTSKAHFEALNGAMQDNNFGFAQSYLNQHSDEMNASDILHARGMLEQGLISKIAMQTSSAAIQKFQSAFSPTDTDRIVNITKQAESGGKDYNLDGTPVTSSAGAKYAMQVTPETAVNPGYGIQPAQNDSPQEYNRVGQQKLAVLIKIYHGDMPKVWGAYNWGEGNVDAAVKAAGQNGNWMASMPAETQTYVANNMKTYLSGGGGSSIPSLQDIHNDIRQQLGPNADPRQLSAALNTGTQMYSDAMNDRKTQAENVVTQAQQWLIQNGGNFNAMPTDLKAAVTQVAPDQWNTLQKFGDAVVSPPQKTNMDAYHSAIEHPEELAAMPDSQFNHFVTTNFSDSDQKQIAKMRQEVINGTGSDSPDSINTQAFNSALENRLTSIGIDAKPKPNDIKAKQQIGTVQKYLTDGIFDQQRQLGRKMTAQEIAQYMDQQFTKNVTFQNSFLGINTGVSSLPYLSMKVGDIPDESLSKLKDAFASRGVANPTNDQLLRAYWKNKNAE